MLVQIGFGAALIGLGTVGYFATGRSSVTALIPAFFGVIVTGLSAVGLASAGLATGINYAIGALSAVGMVATHKALRAVGSAGPASPAQKAKALMSLLCGGLLVATLLTATS